LSPAIAHLIFLLSVVISLVNLSILPPFNVVDVHGSLCNVNLAYAAPHAGVVEVLVGRAFGRGGGGGGEGKYTGGFPLRRRRRGAKRARGGVVSYMYSVHIAVALL